MTQGRLEFDTPVQDPVGFDIGWEHARHALAPPPAWLGPGSALRQGWEAGQARFGRRTRAATPSVRDWLRLRLQAWERGSDFELRQVTPQFLRQIEVGHCPVTREPLTQGLERPTDASVAQLLDTAGCTAGNLVMLSAAASQARAAARDLPQVQAQQQRLARGGLASLDGLTAAQWARLATLLSFVTPLPHEEAARLPLHLLPPPRLRLANPVQGLQALLTLQLAHPQWSPRLSRIEALFQALGLRQDYNLFIHTLIPRLLAAQVRDDPLRTRWALEDAWSHEALNRRWQRLVLRLDADASQTLIGRMVARGLAPQGWLAQAEEPTAEGWTPERPGYAAPARRRAPQRAAGG
ncbi:hypothetical protein [Azohydromonas caseinilytica]|uniref:Uncharacterized protein n=1 Tax=Azohydromonas caseinilytica TaxID=2728836 RepID=A0A848FB03_9BURK|nr:hypothetical protein [Azohydromonas caseinilytica]NML15619.1 hypothetical protein [Azohydromonas caseinilytica]